jgi:hypothetical protein
MLSVLLSCLDVLRQVALPRLGASTVVCVGDEDAQPNQTQACVPPKHMATLSTVQVIQSCQRCTAQHI